MIIISRYYTSVIESPKAAQSSKEFQSEIAERLKNLGYATDWINIKNLSIEIFVKTILFVLKNILEMDLSILLSNIKFHLR